MIVNNTLAVHYDTQIYVPGIIIQFMGSQLFYYGL